jgi:hypothetical protein
LDELIPSQGYHNHSRSNHKAFNLQSYPSAATSGTPIYRPPSQTGILTTIQPNAAVGAPKLRAGGVATLGTTTIEYDDPSSMIYGGGVYGEDMEAQYFGRGAPRVASYNPRNQVSSRLHKTIDENLLVNRILSNSRNNFLKRENGGLDEATEDRMRIFEDEIIKRIKIIQNFVKNMDGKVNRLRAAQKQQQQDSQRKNSQNQ